MCLSPCNSFGKTLVVKCFVLPTDTGGCSPIFLLPFLVDVRKLCTPGKIENCFFLPHWQASFKATFHIFLGDAMQPKAQTLQEPATKKICYLRPNFGDLILFCSCRGTRLGMNSANKTQLMGKCTTWSLKQLPVSELKAALRRAASQIYVNERLQDLTDEFLFAQLESAFDLGERGEQGKSLFPYCCVDLRVLGLFQLAWDHNAFAPPLVRP